MSRVTTLIDNNLSVLELRTVAFDHVDASGVPPDAEVNLLCLPVLKEDGAPDTGHDGVDHGVV